MSDVDLGEFSVEVTTVAQPGVVAGKVPQALADLLAAKVPEVLKEPDKKELTIAAHDEASAKKIALYARAWGAQQEPRLYITKVPNRRDMENRYARLKVRLDSEVDDANKPGRKPAK